MSKEEKLGAINLETGEIYEDGIEVFKSIKKEQYINRINALNTKYKEKPNELTSEEIEELIKYKNKELGNVALKDYDRFSKYYTGNKEKLDECLDILSDSAYKCLSKLIIRYTSSANTIQHKNHVNITKDKDIAKVVNVTTRRWVDIKKELITIGAIRKIKLDGNVLYKINPTIIGHSMKVTTCTYYAFRNELIKEFEPIKSLYWDKRLLEEFGSNIFEA